MWYQENNNLIRAPVPPSFDKCLKKLEDDDSVLFESISFPSVNTPLKKDKKRKASSQISRPITPTGTNTKFSDDFLSSDSNDIFTPPPKPMEFTNNEELIQKIQYLEKLNQQKDQEIRRLQSEIQKIKRFNSYEKKKPDLNPNSPQRMAIFYKTKYEQLKEQFEKFKENLISDGKIKKYRLKTTKELNLPINTLR